MHQSTPDTYTQKIIQFQYMHIQANNDMQLLDSHFDGTPHCYVLVLNNEHKCLCLLNSYLQLQ